MPDPPGQTDGGPPIALSPPTFTRHDGAAKYVESIVRTRPPRESRQRSPGYAAGAWGLLAAGSTIPAGSGLSLGSADLELCRKDYDDPAELVQTGETVTVYNSGDAITASGGDLAVPLLWINGEWSVGTGGGAGGGGFERCDCPEATYEVEVECGPCANAYGPYRMPRYWWFAITGASESDYLGYGAEECPLTECSWLVGSRVLLEYQEGAYDQPCIWYGEGRCMKVEFRFVPGNAPRWQITITDQDDCVLAVYVKPPGELECCGDNGHAIPIEGYGPEGDWTLEPESPCEYSFSLEPHECTCCPEPDTCAAAAPGFVFCTNTDCCYIQDCEITVTVNGLFSPPTNPCTLFDDPCYTADGEDCPHPVGDPGRLSCFTGSPSSPSACGGMNGAYTLSFAGDCEWRFSGVPGGGSKFVAAELALSGYLWTLTLLGEDGQTAVFTSDECIEGDEDGWRCERFVDLCFAEGESTCQAVDPAPNATFTLSLPG